MQKLTAASPEMVIIVNIAELRQEASDARDLASKVAASASVRDLLSYASALEADAANWQHAFLPFQSGFIVGGVGRLH